MVILHWYSICKRCPTFCQNMKTNFKTNCIEPNIQYSRIYLIKFRLNCIFHLLTKIEFWSQSITQNLLDLFTSIWCTTSIIFKRRRMRRWGWWRNLLRIICQLLNRRGRWGGWCCCMKLLRVDSRWLSLFSLRHDSLGGAFIAGNYFH